MRLGLSVIRNSLNRNVLGNPRLFSQKPPVHLGTEVKPDPQTARHDYIGAPDKESNLRPIVRHIPPDETPLGQRLREKRLEVEAWNQDFWARHNKRYYEERDDFVQAHKDQGIENISADKMSVFYKKFLDKNKKLHLYYNVSWYMKNVDLLLLSGQFNLQTLWRKIRN